MRLFRIYFRLLVASDPKSYHTLRNELADIRSINDSEERCDSSSVLIEAGSVMERTISSYFGRLGVICARHPIMVIVAWIIFVGICSGGLAFTKITTDPVDLWSSPTSRSRKEKNYYDKTFSPFYRTEQIIITAPHSKSSIYTTREGTTQQIEFGPVLQHDILEQVKIKIALYIYLVIIYMYLNVLILFIIGT